MLFLLAAALVLTSFSTMASKLSTNRKFDVVVYGATGFTGSLVAEYFAKEYSATNLKWAIAGRSQSKLQSLKQKLNLGPNVDVLVADAADQKSLDAMAESTKVVLSTTGPFALYGTPLVDACVRSSTNYCDITGESQWIRGIIDGYHDQAAASKLKIVNCCGFDCIPSDLGVMMMVDAMKEQGLEPEEIRYVMKESLGGASGGTIASVIPARARPGQGVSPLDAPDSGRRGRDVRTQRRVRGLVHLLRGAPLPEHAVVAQREPEDLVRVVPQRDGAHAPSVIQRVRERLPLCDDLRALSLDEGRVGVAARSISD
jgi:hypothetical protein